MNPTDVRWMALALSLGQRGLGQVWPNPAVGCVIIRDGQLVGRGWTQPGGRPHGEVEALRQAGAKARGATAYVTLEPCAHHGKTPPCAQALIDAGIARVVGAISDPDPRVAGKGYEMLKAAKIPVTTGVLAENARQTHIGFLSRITKSRPAITLKLAASLDGRIATHSGDSRWITGPQARRHVHMLRANHDAVMIGSGTAIGDDPDLSVRNLGLAGRSPVRVVIDTSLRTPLASRLAKTAGKSATWMCHGPDAATVNWRKTGAKLIACNTIDTGQIDLNDALEKLAAKGLTRVLVEGGGQLAASLIKLDLVDELQTFTAGVAIGGDGRAQLGALGIDALKTAPRFKLIDSRNLDGDILNIWRPS